MFEAFENWYSRVVSKAINLRAWVVSIAIILVGISFYVLPSIPFELAPETSADEIRIRMDMDGGTNIAIMYEYLMELDEIVQRVVPMEDVRYVTRDVRDGRAQIDLTLVDQRDRTRASDDLADVIRERIQGLIPGASIRVDARTGLWVLRRVFRGGGDDGEAVQLQLRGYDLETAEELALMIRDRLELLDIEIDRLDAEGVGIIRGKLSRPTEDEFDLMPRLVGCLGRECLGDDVKAEVVGLHARGGGEGDKNLHR